MHSNDQRNLHIRNLYEAGLSLQEIGDRIGISGERVRQVLIEVGARIRPQGRRAIYDRAVVLAKFIDGQTRKEIAADLGCHPSVVCEVIRNAGFPGSASPSCRVHNKQDVIRLRKKGLTFSEIAARLNITRSAVAGVVHRASAPRLEAAE